jgi:hypothetical protein
VELGAAAAAVELWAAAPATMQATSVMKRMMIES